MTDNKEQEINDDGQNKDESSLNTETLNVEEMVDSKKPDQSTDSDAAENEAEAGKAEKEEDFKERYYYIAAEMENLRKRHQRERDNLLKFGNEKILTSLIEVVDNLDRTLDALDGDLDEKIKNIVDGVDMVRKQFIAVLSGSGLKSIDCLGKTFDPKFHEALSQQAIEGKDENEIITEFQKGYMLNGRLLRAAKVVIAK